MTFSFEKRGSCGALCLEQDDNSGGNSGGDAEVDGGGEVGEQEEAVEENEDQVHCKASVSLISVLQQSALTSVVVEDGLERSLAVGNGIGALLDLLVGLAL